LPYSYLVVIEIPSIAEKISISANLVTNGMITNKVQNYRVKPSVEFSLPGCSI